MTMAGKRKKWAVAVDVAHWNKQRCDSLAAAYRKVGYYREQYAAGMLRGSRVTVYVDEGDGRGWQRHERVDLAA